MVYRIFLSLILIALVFTSNLSFGLQYVTLSPYQQMANGILPEDVVCPTGFSIIVKLATNSPACVKSSTMAKLIERNWGANSTDSNGKVALSMPYVANVSNSNFTVSYAVTGATVTEIQKDTRSYILHVFLQTKNDGSLTIEFPQKLIGPENPNMSGYYIYVLNDGSNNQYRVIKTTTVYKIIQIAFIQGTREIAIIGSRPL